MSKLFEKLGFNPIDAMLEQVRSVIVGYPDVTEKFAYCIFGDGHILLKSVPGLAKTLMVRAFHASIGNATSARIQMTPNIMPADITGGEILNMESRKFEVRKGPAFVNLLLADEINRATPKAQSALLEAMAERRVSLAGQTFNLPDPFVTCATMNPIEQEGTYPLPEAQLDRFMFQIDMGYVNEEAELAILHNANLRGRNPLAGIKPVVTTEQIVEIRDYIRNPENVYVSPAAEQYICSLVRSTRPGDPRFLEVTRKAQAQGKQVAESVLLGGSPRAMQCLVATASVRALHQGRDFVLPEDIKYVAPDVLRHRILLTQRAKMNRNFGGTEAVVNMVLKHVPVVEGDENYVKASA